MLTQPSVVDNNVMGLIPNDLIDEWYLYYWMQQFDLRSVTNIGPVPSMRKTEVEKIRIPLPTPSEQRRIVEILDQADALRKKHAEADAKAARILPALFYKMFGDPATNPKGLDKKRLGDLIKVRSGNFLPAKNMDPEGQYPVYGGNGINGYHSEYMFEQPVIVLGRVGVYCGAVYYSEPKCWVTDNALYVAEQSDDLHPRYLAEALRVANLNQYAGRAGQSLISGSRIYPVEILVPPPEDQEAFARSIVNLHRDEKRRKDAGDHIESLFSVLLHRAFTGDLTAQWREAHKDQLEAEMREQMAALEEAKAHKPKRSRKSHKAGAGSPSVDGSHAGHDMFNKAALVTYIVTKCHDPQRPIGRTKLAKLFYLVQRRAEISLTEQFARRAAGPLDDAIHKFLNLAKKNGWLALPKAKGNLKPVVPGDDPQPAIDHVRQRWEDALTVMDAMLDVMKGWGWEALERWATVENAAQQLAAEGKPISLNAIKKIIAAEPKWRPKLQRDAFSDLNIQRTLKGLCDHGYLPAEAGSNH